MRVLIYPGSFDPLTIGHEDIARRAAALCDRLYVAVLQNAQKRSAFTVEERLWMIRSCLGDVPNIDVAAHQGLLVDFYREKGAQAVVRGLRSESDFRYESELATANKLLCPGYESILLPCRMDLAFTSSSVVREVASYGGDLAGMVPAAIRGFVAEKLCAVRRGDRDEAETENFGETIRK